MENDFKLESLSNNILNSENKYLIWGTGVSGKRFYEKYKKKLNIIGFIDSDKSKQKYTIDNLKIISPLKLTKEKEIKVIICVLGYYELIEKSLLDKGYDINIDFFYEKEFVTIYEFNKKDKLNLWHLNLHITEKCTLKCKNCSALIPYVVKPENISLDKICEDLKIFFSKVDFVHEFHIIGGEPMMYPRLEELVKIIGNLYRNKIGEFAIATNGTVMPSQKLLMISEKYKVVYIISDYTKSEQFEGGQKGEQLNELLLKHNICTRYSDKNTWLDFGNPKEIRFKLNKDEQKYRFNRCRTINRVLREGKLYYCHHHLGAILANYTDEENGSYIDLKDWDLITKKEIILFDLGFIEKGYLKFCMNCNGYEGLNNKKIPAAKQLSCIVGGGTYEF